MYFDARKATECGVALLIEDEIEGTGGEAFEGGVKIRARIFSERGGKNSQRVKGVERRQRRVPARDEREIFARRNFGVLQLALKLPGGIVREAQINGSDGLVQQRRAGKKRELLLFDGIAGCGQDVSATGENGASDLAVEGGEKREAAFFECQLGVATLEFDAAASGKRINGGGIELQISERGVLLPRRPGIGGGGCRSKRN